MFQIGVNSATYQIFQTSFSGLIITMLKKNSGMEPVQWYDPTPHHKILADMCTIIQITYYMSMKYCPFVCSELLCKIDQTSWTFGSMEHTLHNFL